MIRLETRLRATSAVGVLIVAVALIRWARINQIDELAVSSSLSRVAIGAVLRRERVA